MNLLQLQVIVKVCATIVDNCLNLVPFYTFNFETDVKKHNVYEN